MCSEMTLMGQTCRIVNKPSAYLFTKLLATGVCVGSWQLRALTQQEQGCVCVMVALKAVLWIGECS